MPLTIKINAHQSQHHNRSRPGKSIWNVSIDAIIPQLTRYVQSHENAIRQAIQEEQINREPGQNVRNVFYLTNYFASNNIFNGSYHGNEADGVCVEVVIEQKGPNMTVCVHGYPASIKKEDISLSSNELIH